MAMMAHNPEKARKAGVTRKVAQEYNKADQRSGRLSKAMKGKGRGR
jgi:hypothetical protein